jgi:uncharacterized membrane protein YeaQ/YmgE (transglycosylase-associated protein family)
MIFGFSREETPWKLACRMLSFGSFVGILAGTVTGMIVKGDRRGFGVLHNLGLGMTGALVGGILFRVFRLFPNLDKFSLSMRDLISALIGSALVLFILWVRQRLPKRG